MKKLYFSLVFVLQFTIVFSQTSPTGTSDEVGVTQGDLTISLDGNANYSIPIALPKGINNVEPSINLSYNSQSGLNGMQQEVGIS